MLNEYPQDDQLIKATAWAGFTAARQDRELV